MTIHVKDESDRERLETLYKDSGELWLTSAELALEGKFREAEQYLTAARTSLEYILKRIEEGEGADALRAQVASILERESICRHAYRNQLPPPPKRPGAN